MPTVILLAGESWGLRDIVDFQLFNLIERRYCSKQEYGHYHTSFFLLSDPEDVEYEDVVSVLRGITLTERERVGQVKNQHSFSPRPVAI